MEDLQYIVSLGFSSSDLPRAVLLTFFIAMFANKDTNIWKVGLFALAVDSAIWPITAMAASGADIQSIYASIGAFFKTFLDNLGIYIVRYMGLVLMIGGFRWGRARIHKLAPKKQSKPAHA